MTLLKTISPIDGSVYVDRVLATDAQIASAVARARATQRGWASLAVAERAAQISRLVDAFVALKPEIAGEITRQMGRPIRYTPNEVGGFEERALHDFGCASGP